MTPFLPRMRAAALASSLALVSITAIAHGDAHPAKPRAAPSTEQHDWGREGDPRRVTRTLTIDMSDRMRFSPDVLKVRLGDTVRLRVENSGAAMHELVIGTEAALIAHAELMKKHPGMEHDAPYMAHVAPRRQADLVWTFNRAGTFHYGCLIPGHWEAGMKGLIQVQ
jgi:uncharacterized cupredoxin-like copper-binding protein